VLARRLERYAVEGTGEVGHCAKVQFAGDHFIGQRRATGEVFPLHVVGRVLVLAVVRQVFVQQPQLADQQAARGTVDGGVLGADGHPDRLCLGRQAQASQHQAGQGCAQ